MTRRDSRGWDGVESARDHHHQDHNPGGVLHPGKTLYSPLKLQKQIQNQQYIFVCKAFHSLVKRDKIVKAPEKKNKEKYIYLISINTISYLHIKIN